MSFCHHSILQSTEPLVCGQNSRAAGEGFICECLSGYDMLVEDNNSCTGNLYSSHLLHHWYNTRFSPLQTKMNVWSSPVIRTLPALTQWAALSVFVEKAILGLDFPVQVLVTIQS